MTAKIKKMSDRLTDLGIPHDILSGCIIRVSTKMITSGPGNWRMFNLQGDVSFVGAMTDLEAIQFLSN